MNFAHQPDAVTEVVAVEPEGYLRDKAVEAATRADVAVTVVAGTAEQLPAETSEFDAAVTSLVLCSVHDQGRALREAHRVLRPGGELRYYERVQADASRLRRAQQLADRTIWPKVAGGCHAGRHTGTAIVDAGFEIEEERRFRSSHARWRSSPPHTSSGALGAPERGDDLTVMSVSGDPHRAAPTR